MSDTLIALAAVTAVVAGIRGTWSPCGLSMLSSITPVTERARGHRYGTTATWFIIGAAVGGACMGGVAALGALVVGFAGLGDTAVLVAAALLALVGAASDLRLFGLALPVHPRQVDETWLRKYRSWVYGGGFGWQIGTGFATYIMTAATYLTVALAMLSGQPLAAFGIGVLFGVVRGSAVLLSARSSTPASLARLHTHLERLAPISRGLAIGGQVTVAVAAAGLLARPTGPALLAISALPVVALVVALAVVAVARPSRSRAAIR